MDQYKQGETYDEEPMDQSQEETTQPKFVMNGAQVKLIAGFGIAVVLLLVIILSISKFNSGKTDDTSTSSAEEEWEQFVNSQEQEVIEETNTSQSSTESYNYDSFNTELRKWGYTGDEIEFFKSNGYNPKDLIKQAKEERAKAIEDAASELASKTSKTYKQLLSMTWLGGKKINIKDQSGLDGANFELSTYTYNADYDKCDPTGNQLFIRLTMEDDSYAFMAVAPDRWVQLRQSGNIVVTYDVYTYGDSKIITSITEVTQGGENATN